MIRRTPVRPGRTLFVRSSSTKATPGTNKVRPGLTGVRRIIGIATYEDSRWSVLRERDNGRRMLLRALRLNTGIRTRTGWVALHRAASATDAQRAAFVARVERHMTRL